MSMFTVYLFLSIVCASGVETMLSRRTGTAINEARDHFQQFKAFCQQSLVIFNLKEMVSFPFMPISSEYEALIKTYANVSAEITKADYNDDGIATYFSMEFDDGSVKRYYTQLKHNSNSSSGWEMGEVEAVKDAI